MKMNVLRHPRFWGEHRIYKSSMGLESPDSIHDQILEQVKRKKPKGGEMDSSARGSGADVRRVNEEQVVYPIEEENGGSRSLGCSSTAGTYSWWIGPHHSSRETVYVLTRVIPVDQRDSRVE